MLIVSLLWSASQQCACRLCINGPKWRRKAASSGTDRDSLTSSEIYYPDSWIALKISQRAYVLATGKVELEGLSADLLQKQELRRYYLGG